LPDAEIANFHERSPAYVTVRSSRYERSSWGRPRVVIGLTMPMRARGGTQEHLAKPVTRAFGHDGVCGNGKRSGKRGVLSFCRKMPTPKAAQRATKAVPASPCPQPSYRHDRTVTRLLPSTQTAPPVAGVMLDVISGFRVHSQLEDRSTVWDTITADGRQLGHRSILDSGGDQRHGSPISRPADAVTKPAPARHSATTMLSSLWQNPRGVRRAIHPG